MIVEFKYEIDKSRAINIYRDGEVIGFVRPVNEPASYDCYLPFDDHDNGVELGYVFQVYNEANKRIIIAHVDDRGVAVFFDNYEERVKQVKQVVHNLSQFDFEDDEQAAIRKLIVEYHNR